MHRTDLRSEEASEAARAWWLMLIVGLVSVVAGVILVLRPSHSLETLAVVVGIFLLVDGLVELVESFGRSEHRAFAAILGVLGIVVGIVLIRHPFHGVTAVGLLLGIWLVAAGVVRFVRAVSERRSVLLQSIVAFVEAAVGVAIVSDPHIGYTALALIAGIWLIINGLGMMTLAVALHTVTRGR